MDCKAGVEFDEELLDKFVFTRHYGLTPSNINDKLYNIVVEAWRSVVLDRFIVAIEFTSAEAAEAFKVNCLTKIFMNGKLLVFLNEVTRYLFSYVLRLPRTMTLPQDVKQLEKHEDEQEIIERIKKTEKEVAELKAELQNLTYEADGYEKAANVLKAMKSSKN
ncbi:hypothetical protein QR680_017263 [Steinernema hermaphroditum]|uniref:Protein MIS12 homolog n=1 Tax=Steinernema hermaphroditum TaxID=289476 RepID=A0AA39LP21_9BILA|nr:hypothetical protein QR680_017263 [Steinernema hermaphroditum]